MKLLREVEEKVNRPFSEKFLETQSLIAHNLLQYRGKVAVAFSGGKDSEVVLRLAMQLMPEIPVVFNNTGVEHPETVKFVRQLEIDWNLNLIVTTPEKSFWQCIEKYGFPQGTKRKKKGRKNPQCCYWLKEKPMKLAIRELGLECYFTGTTASESYQRMFAARDFGTCFYAKKYGSYKVHPILWWTEDEVWQYLGDVNLPSNLIYAKGAKRCGCMPCTAYKTWESQMRKINPKMYALIKLRKDKQYVMPLGRAEDLLQN